MSKQQYVDPVKSLMFKTLAKAKLLTPEEEVSLSRKCRAAKVKVWEEILSDFHNVDTILSYATQRMSSLNREKLDDSKLANLRRSTVLLQRSSTKYRVHVFDKARTAAAVEVSKGDVCLQIGASMVKDLEDGVYLVPDGLAGRVSSSWKVFVKLRNEFIERNMRLVMSLAKRYRGFNIPYEDLIQEGMFGLQRAVDLFDPDRGFKFSHIRAGGFVRPYKDFAGTRARLFASLFTCKRRSISTRRSFKNRMMLQTGRPPNTLVSRKRKSVT